MRTLALAAKSMTSLITTPTTSPITTPPILHNDFVRLLPGDAETRNFRRQVNNACYSTVRPLAFPHASLLAYSADLAAELGLAPDKLGTANFAAYFSGSTLLPGSEPYAQCYGGHQFGNWAGQLGDGRAINLGEVFNSKEQSQVLQLKGAGPTPYSRTADGLAVLRSSLREFLCSEAMQHLGIPTTRALSLVTTGEKVMRDMFYDGNPNAEPGAVVCRVAPSFLRFGSYEIFTSRNQLDTLKQLADFTIRRHFPHLLGSTGTIDHDTYAHWFNEICQRTALLLVEWMRVGFVHGVMNTDNMSILGLTIDYGPYGWLEPYAPGWTPNTTDAELRRYRFGQQPQVAQWNLVQLANALYPLAARVKPLEDALDHYRQTYEHEWLQMMRRKLGLTLPADDDIALINQLTTCLQSVETDMTLFFRALATVDLADLATIPPALRATWYDDKPGTATEQQWLLWLQAYAQRCATDVPLTDMPLIDAPFTDRQTLMNSVNPLYVLRNSLVQQAIDAAEQGDLARLHELQQVLQHPYTVQAGKDHLAQKRPEWARHKAGCSMLSCSS
jgi:serine/tyrosine/threonine adenylyltransferase